MPSFTKNINLISHCGSAYRAEGLAGSGLSHAHYFYILALCNNPGISQEQLARRLYLNKSSVTRAIAALEENGFVQRRPCEEDKRVTRVYPTDKATEILPEVRRIARAWNDFLLSELEENERQQFLTTLDKITKKAQSYIDLDLSAEDLQNQ